MMKTKLTRTWTLKYNFLRLFRQYEDEGELPDGYDDLSDDEVLDLVATDLSEFVDKLQDEVIALIDRADRNSRHLSVQAFEEFLP